MNRSHAGDALTGGKVNRQGCEDLELVCINLSSALGPDKSQRVSLIDRNDVGSKYVNPAEPFCWRRSGRQ
jgi:hypothetical protein